MKYYTDRYKPVICFLGFMDAWRFTQEAAALQELRYRAVHSIDGLCALGGYLRAA